MHIVIIAVFVLALIYVLPKLLSSRNSSDQSNHRSHAASTNQASWGDASPAVAVAFIADGKLFYKAAGGPVEQIHSPYIAQAAEKVARNNERNAWKKGTSFEISANRGVKEFEVDDAQISTTSVYLGQNQTMLYFLQDKVMGGLFSYDLAARTEQRILHRQNLALTDLTFDAVSAKILGSASHSNGSANLAMMDADGSNYREITAGDTVDGAPVAVPQVEQQIIFQSAGIARSPEGHVLAHSHTSLQMLDLHSGQLSPVLDDPQFDYILPRLSANGNLLFIRRPYEMPKYATGNILLDLLLFPFRLLRAVFHYLNFFSMMYSRKPLTSASGPAMQADLKDIILKGKRINAEKALRKEAAINGIPSLVPGSWQLVSRTRQGAEQVLARNVASYDIAADGRIVYSNGRAVFVLDANNQSQLVLKSDLVSEVIAEHNGMAHNGG